MTATPAMYHQEKRNVAIPVICQVMFMIAAITVMTLSGVVGQQLSPDPGLATLPIAIMMLGTVFSTLPATLHTEAERGKLQGINDLVIFILVTIGSLMSGTLLHHLGWETMNLLMLAPIGVIALSVLWMRASSKRNLASAA